MTASTALENRTPLAIEATGIVKTYGDLRAVDNLDLSVPQGIVFALLGPNGAGKTTTVEILEGLRRTTSGSARVLGHDITRSYEDIRQIVGILPQDFEPFDRLTAREHIRYFAGLFGRSLDGEEMARILASVSLQERADAQARKLSGGEKRKLGIALALVGNPQLVFLDEPTTGLDPAARRDLWKVVEGLREEDRTVVLTTHYIEEAEALANDVAIMVRGQIVASGSPASLLDEHTDTKEIRLVGVGSDSLDTLRGQGLTVTPDGEDLIIETRSADDLSEVFRLISQGGLVVRDVVTTRPSLEDVFLAIVGHGIEEGELKA
ncbi:MAG: ATP-binding cassette domain-containing protein [Thermoplasmata archaeon]